MDTLKKIIGDKLTGLMANYALSRNIELPEGFGVKVHYPPELKFGNYSTPVALENAKLFKAAPRVIAEELSASLKEDPEIGAFFDQIRIEGPGFINFFISPGGNAKILSDLFISRDNLRSLMHTPKPDNILFEFVSANPTGPLNIVSARAAAVGDVICRLLEATGNKVEREFYVNDYGNQVRLLGISFAYRYLIKLGADLKLPDQCYQGEYVNQVLDDILNDVDQGNISFPEADFSVDKIIENVQASPEENVEPDSVTYPVEVEMLGEFFAPLAIEKLRSSQERDLLEFGVKFTRFFSEKQLHDQGKVEEVGKKLNDLGFVETSDGATLFTSTRFGDDKDRVIVRSDGRPTYLLADIAYHNNKIERGYNKIYNIWGPDHHGYIARLAGAVQALGFGTAPDKNEEFRVLIVQQVNMIEDGKPVVMSKRLGKFHTMADLLQAVPSDVVRYFFVMRSHSSHLDFDLDLASTQSRVNPVYYIQYAHARIHSIFRETGFNPKETLVENLEDGAEYLSGHKRNELLAHLWRYPETVLDASLALEPHGVCEYLYQCATHFTAFYHEKENRIVAKLAENPVEGKLLLRICAATLLVLEDGLSLLGVSAPEQM